MSQNYYYLMENSNIGVSYSFFTNNRATMDNIKPIAPKEKKLPSVKVPS